MKAHPSFTRFAKATVTAAALAGFFLSAGTPTVRASSESDCQQRIVKADHRLHEAATKHGWNSPQAEEKRRDLSAARERCWEHGHRWWDEDGQRWHTERDWDDHDHH